MREPTIVIVDDDRPFACSLVTSLLLAGSTCVNIGTGLAAADRFRGLVRRQGLPDLLVVDVSLPHLECVPFLSQLAKEGLLCTIVFISKDVSAAELATVLRTPHVGFIDKGCAPTALVQQLRSYCPSPSNKQKRCRCWSTAPRQRQAMA